MKAVIVGSGMKVDYLIETIMGPQVKIVAISPDRTFCEYLSSRFDVDVVCGNGAKRYVLDDAGIDGFDIVIALTESDADNLAVCQLAEQFFDVKTQVCMVSDPRNAGVFRRLGVTAVVSETQMLVNAIDQSLSHALEGKKRQKLSSLPLVDDDDDADETEPARERFITSSFHRIGKA